MRRISLVALLGAVALSGCSTYESVVRITKLEQRANPQVIVSGSTIRVPEVLYFLPGETNVKITWRLPEGQGLSFPENGIEIEGLLTDKVVRSTAGVAVVLDPTQTEIQCDKQTGGVTFSCTNRNSRPGVYKYTIRVRNGDALLQRDPPIVNMP
ncbi:MAG TPA: hypothetical protein VLW55_04210 [Burkholderiaceae bacterium]|nr:hypothetical protein [Burkholderiaceae bacterium]